MNKTKGKLNYIAGKGHTVDTCKSVPLAKTDEIENPVFYLVTSKSKKNISCTITWQEIE